MLCDVCHKQQHKYTCPRCSLKTCSLSCVKLHKKEGDCSGQRDKTAFVAMDQFTESNLLSDYRLLEDTSRQADTASRDPLQRHGTANFLARLKYQSRRRGIDLQILPFLMSKRKQNRTFFDFRTKQIVWFTEWVFTEEEETFTHRFDENASLKASLLHFLHPTTSNPVTSHKLRRYVTAIMSRTSTLTTDPTQSKAPILMSDLTQSQTSANTTTSQLKPKGSEPPKENNQPQSLASSKTDNVDHAENKLKLVETVQMEDNQSAISKEEKDPILNVENSGCDMKSPSEEMETEPLTNAQNSQTDHVSPKRHNEFEFAKACSENPDLKSLEDGEITDESDDGLMHKELNVNKMDDECVNDEKMENANEDVSPKQKVTKDAIHEKSDDCLGGQNNISSNNNANKSKMAETRDSNKRHESEYQRERKTLEKDVDTFCWDDIAVFMKVERCPANKIRYHRLSLAASIADNLKDKVIIEFPTFHVAVRKNWHLFQTE